MAIFNSYVKLPEGNRFSSIRSTEKNIPSKSRHLCWMAPRQKEMVSSPKAVKCVTGRSAAILRQATMLAIPTHLRWRGKKGRTTTTTTKTTTTTTTTTTATATATTTTRTTRTTTRTRTRTTTTTPPANTSAAAAATTTTTATTCRSAGASATAPATACPPAPTRVISKHVHSVGSNHAGGWQDLTANRHHITSGPAITSMKTKHTVSCSQQNIQAKKYQSSLPVPGSTTWVINGSKPIYRYIDHPTFRPHQSWEPFG